MQQRIIFLAILCYSLILTQLATYKILDGQTPFFMKAVHDL